MSIEVRKMNPLKGLLTYFWYYFNVKLTIVLIQVMAVAIAYLIFGHLWIFGIFSFYALSMMSVSILLTMGSKEVDWERFQLSMPVRRNDIAKSQYITVGGVPFLGIPLVILIYWLGSLLHEGAYFELIPMFTMLAPSLSGPLTMCAIIFPLAVVPALEDKINSLFWPIVLISLVIPQLIILLGNNLGWSAIITASAILGLSIVLITISYFITVKLYSKIDF